MRAAVLRRYGQPPVMEDRPEPRAGRGEVVVSVGAVGVCGSDLFLLKGGFDSTLPIIPGHEIAGTVETVGDGVDGALVGRRVAVYYILHDGTCRLCRRGRVNLCLNLRRVGVDVDGGFTERMVVPAVNVIPVDDDVPMVDLAVLTDAVATPYHALTQVGNVVPGETVVVMGVGGIGSNAVQLANHLGARVIAVSRKKRSLALAAALGAAETIVADDLMGEQIRELTGPEGPDVVVQTVGSATVDRQAVDIVGLGGRVVLIGVATERFEVADTELIWKEAQVLGSRGYIPADIRDVVVLWQTGVVRTDHLTQARRPLAEVDEALEDLRAGTVLRTVITP